jgi:hypothetical protein
MIKKNIKFVSERANTGLGFLMYGDIVQQGSLKRMAAIEQGNGGI